MPRYYLTRKHLLAVIVTATVSLTGCALYQGYNDAHLRRETRHTEEAIKQSPVLQELEHLCTKEMPLLAGDVLLYKRMGTHDTYLDYGYHSKAEYQTVKSFYVNYFAQQPGWQLTYQKDSGWGPRHLEFRKDAYKVTIYYGAMGKELTYATSCWKLPASHDGK